MTAAFVPTFTRTLTARRQGGGLALGNLVMNALLIVDDRLVDRRHRLRRRDHDGCSPLANTPRCLASSS